MKKSIIVLFLLYSSSFALFTPSYYNKQVQILRKLDINPNYLASSAFLQNIESLEEVHSGALLSSLKEFYYITPIIREKLLKNNMPAEFLYLAIVESGLKIHSVSNKRAVGIWQFMRPTARLFGLKVNSYVDERRDFVKATEAAISYLSRLKGEFGKWYLAIMAYNCGEARLAKAIKDANSDELGILLDPDKKYLPRETRFFIKKILTMAFVASDNSFLLSKDSALLNYSLSSQLSSVVVPGSASLKKLAFLADMNYKEFRKLNPHLISSRTPPGESYHIYLPTAKLARFKNNLKDIKLAKIKIKVPSTYFYTVKKGDSLYKIAKKHKISIALIKENNKIKNNYLSIGQRLIISKGDKYAAKADKKYSTN